MRSWGRRVGCALLFAYATSALAAQAPRVEREELRKPTTVTADQLEVSLKEHRAIYTGNVELKTGGLTVVADRMEFNFDEKMETVERMISTGNVRITHRDGYTATSERATYYVVQDKVVLDGRARVWRDKNMVGGTRIILFMKEDRQVVLGDESERVTAVIHPKRESGQTR